ncbi:UNVERIFIED_CONTAM: hypothetical protein HDU68_012331 [Siphonaria sp. JEL0065]|nr:hypothetical protein HDU68_012331 [Siphonaria sp. JEL0065]
MNYEMGKKGKTVGPSFASFNSTPIPTTQLNNVNMNKQQSFSFLNTQSSFSKPTLGVKDSNVTFAGFSDSMNKQPTFSTFSNLHGLPSQSSSFTAANAPSSLQQPFNAFSTIQTPAFSFSNPTESKSNYFSNPSAVGISDGTVAQAAFKFSGSSATVGTNTSTFPTPIGFSNSAAPTTLAETSMFNKPGTAPPFSFSNPIQFSSYTPANSNSQNFVSQAASNPFNPTSSAATPKATFTLPSVSAASGLSAAPTPALFATFAAVPEVSKATKTMMMPPAVQNNSPVFTTMNQNPFGTSSIFSSPAKLPATTPSFTSAAAPNIASSFSGNSPNTASTLSTPTVYSSIDHNPYGNHPMFPSPTEKTFTSTNENVPTLKSFQEPTAPVVTPDFKLAVRLSPKSASRLKLRGFTATPQSPHSFGQNRTGFSNTCVPKSVMLMLQETKTDVAIAETNLFRPRVKKLIVGHTQEKEKEEEQVGIRERGTFESSPPPPPPLSSPTSSLEDPFSLTFNEFGYATSPSFHDLMEMSDAQLRRVNQYTITLPGIGKVQFLEPVNLLLASPTNTRKGIALIPGTVVVIAPKMVQVYPNDEEKDPRGLGLNVSALISLEKCWVLDRKSGEVIVDEHDSRFVRHFTKLESVEGTTLVGFNKRSGVWKFRVDGF